MHPGWTSKSEEGKRPLLSDCLTLERPHLECYSPDTLRRAQGRPQRLSEVLEHLTYEERLRELGMFSLRNRKLKGDLVAITNFLMQG